MASGFLNALSYWFFLLSSVLMIISVFLEGGPASAGWDYLSTIKRIT